MRQYVLIKATILGKKTLTCLSLTLVPTEDGQNHLLQQNNIPSSPNF